MSREIAILIDGGFFTKRLPKLVQHNDHPTAQETAFKIRDLCRNQVRNLTGSGAQNWHKHVYRIFYYDAYPFEGQAHHPLTNEQINFARTERAKRQIELFHCLKKERNVALRLGNVGKINGWTLNGPILKKLLQSKGVMEELSAFQPNEDGSITISAEGAQNLANLTESWSELQEWMIKLDLRQKGVDMRIGLDIASITLKRLAKTIILVAGDADFVPAAKLARREGLQFILDPLWQNVSEDLFEHIDGLHSGLPRPNNN